ncbi:Na/Pi cotransporter family protein [Sediminispirochaeta smaragdinae]|uniref:Na/Pi-cotransporter II-related protein n=1 Tax=Sediminispirochaeta smaragdinae (strain DSM 11293 / JCM 15392 / SEBR 4228) TaxID=573413 RepID=E1R7T1_SEDSS|nr:Na/Pi cotransporter family protein [Sediminispirochaeta smaragdinae]ADK82786.1 Na/Pi-cotransporter II-related protein [Sediminispirochaeta smaragdinae DSM 11293]
MIYTILQIAGSLGLFLFGMRTMSDGIQKAAGERLQAILNFMTGNRFAAIFTGFAITAIIQSSSATTVMVVSFVNAGLLQLTQAIGVIMGANIGTTVTGWIVAILGFKVKISAMALPAIGIGLPLIIIKKLEKEEVGEAIIGFGILFLGLSFLKDSVPDIKNHPEILQFLSNLTGSGLGPFLLFVMVGTLLTIVVQSSSAAMAITLTMAYAGWIDFQTAAAIVLGENIGTTVTAYLASIGTSVNARRASRAHTLFNVFGVFWMMIFFRPFLAMINMMVPGDVFAPGSANLIPSHLAMFHTMFNITNTIICSFFIKQIALVVTTLVPEEKGNVSGNYRLKYISASLQDTPELYLLTIKKELAKMTSIVSEMFDRFWEVFDHPDKKMGGEVERLKGMEDFTDQMQEEITRFLSSCSLDSMNKVSAANVYSMMRITNELESIGDGCYNLIVLAERRYKKKLKIDKEAVEDLRPYADLVHEFLEFITSHLNAHLSRQDLEVAQKIETKINKRRNTLKKNATKRLQHGAEVKAELLYIDVVRHVERIGDHCLNVAESLRQVY